MNDAARMLADQLDGSVKNSAIGLVRPALLRGDYHFKQYTKLFDRLGE
jgi:hypothetical protein